MRNTQQNRRGGISMMKFRIPASFTPNYHIPSLLANIYVCGSTDSFATIQSVYLSLVIFKIADGYLHDRLLLFSLIKSHEYTLRDRVKHDKQSRETLNRELECRECIMRKFHAIRRLLGCILFSGIPFQPVEFRLSVFSSWINYTGYGGCSQLPLRK